MLLLMPLSQINHPTPLPGMTPQRRDFQYPQQLTRTRPHTELLEEYRSTTMKSNATVLPRVPESDMEEDTSTTVSQTSLVKLSWVKYQCKDVCSSTSYCVINSLQY